MQALWERVHSRTSDWRTYGFIRGIMRSVLQLRTPQNGNGDQHKLGGLNGAEGEGSLQAPPAKVRFREPQIEMAHGAGAKPSRRVIEALFPPFLFGPAAESLEMRPILIAME